MRDTLSALIAGERLNANDARDLLLSIIRGEMAPAQIAAVLTIFQIWPILVDELAGFRVAMLMVALPCDLSQYDPIDICGTGGDGKDTFNISTLTAFLVAACGVPVAKHGNYGVSSRFGSSNLLEALGIPFPESEADAKRILEETSIVFLHAPLWHPGMKRVALIRKELGFKTVFNLLGPLVNPARPKKQLIGVATLEVFTLYRELLLKERNGSVIVHSFDGYDEVSLTDTCMVSTPTRELALSPEDFGLSKTTPAELAGGATLADSLSLATTILGGKGTEAQTNVLAANAGLALYTVNPTRSVKECVAQAKEVLRAGAPLEILKKCQAVRLSN